jgi:hypothetical protein
MQNRHIVIAVVVLVALVLAFVFWRQAPDPEPPPVRDDEVMEPVPPPVSESDPVSPMPEPEPVVEPLELEPIFVLPRLNESDDFVREQAREVIEVDADKDWLQHEDLVRRFAVMVDNAATGNVPRQQLDFLAPEGAFPVVREDDSVFLDERGYERYDPVVDTLVRVEPERAVGLIHTLSPLIAQALQELGYREPNPDARIRAAIDHALATPVIEDRIELVQPGVLYEYADPELEGLSRLQKQLMRMGPDNLRRIQSYLQEVRDQLDARDEAAADDVE